MRARGRVWQLAAAVVAVPMVAVGLTSGGATAVDTTDAAGFIQPVGECADLAGDYDIPSAGTHVTAAKVVPATGTDPEYCEVSGYVDPAVKFVLKLPTTTYKGRYLQYGCGGFCGAVSPTAFPDCGPEPGEFAVAATNDGHDTPPEAGVDGSWGADDQAVRDDWSFRAPHVVSVAAKELIATFYGSPPEYSYFSGCSNGGREALMLAQRYPHDFDGIVAGAPAHAISPLLGMYLAWEYRVNRDADGKEILTSADLPILHEAAIAACDELDGLVDGQIDDPRLCDFDPASVQCPKGEDGADCLTAAQVEAARKMYQGPVDADGRRLYPGGQTPGSELSWMPWHVEDPASPVLISRDLADGLLKYLGYPIGSPHSSVADIEFTAAELDRLTAEGRKMNAMNTDLAAFEQAGGKLIIWHGWADPAIPAAGTLDYYQRLAEDNGGLQATRSWARTFMIPSLHHCAGGVGLTEFDATKAMVEWVENDAAPERIVAVGRDDNGTAVRTRPVFPYPLRAAYDGSGNIDDAANFVPAEPEGPVNDIIEWAGEELYDIEGPVAKP